MPLQYPALEKLALEVEQGKLPSRALANSIGRVSNALDIVPWLITERAFLNPKRDEHEPIANAMAKAEPDRLDYAKLRFGGGDAIDDVVWRRGDAANKLKWYQRLGGRVAHNPRTGLGGKTLGYASYPITALLSHMERSPHYNPFTDVATNYWDTPAVTSHELGHALDFDYNVSKKKGLAGLLTRFGQRQLGDAYKVAPSLSIPVPGVGELGIPGALLYYEAEANRHSRNALEKSLVKKPEQLRAIKEDRARVLTPAYATYLISQIGQFMPGAGIIPRLGGVLAARGVGDVMADQISQATPRQLAKHELKRQVKEKTKAESNNKQ